MSAGESAPDVASFAMHGTEPSAPILGRLVERGQHDELKGTAYVVIDGIDGRTHYAVFPDLDVTGDAKAGAIVETRAYDEAGGRRHLSLATRSELTIEAQVTASDATWLDRQLLAKETVLSGAGFGADVREATDRRIDHLVEQDEREHVSGVYRQRVTLASGRFAMIDDGMGFQLVPWRPALEPQFGERVLGTISRGGGIDWNFNRSRGIGI